MSMQSLVRGLVGEMVVGINNGAAFVGNVLVQGEDEEVVHLTTTACRGEEKVVFEKRGYVCVPEGKTVDIPVREIAWVYRPVGG